MPYAPLGPAAYLIGHALTAAGTLVIAIPTRDGLVVAADSRTTVAGEYFDGRKKLHLVRTRPAVVFTITGTADFADPPPPGVTIREWFPRAPYRFRGSVVVEAALRANQAPRLTLDSVSAVASDLASSLDQYFSRVPLAGAAFRGRELCRLAMFQADDGTLIFGSAVAFVTAGGRVVRGAPTLKTYQPDSPKTLEFIGENEYTVTHVLRGEGRRFLSDRVGTILKGAERVRDLSAHDAALLAQSIIQAVEATTALIPAPSGNGVGGPVHGYLITAKSVGSLDTFLKGRR